MKKYFCKKIIYLLNSVFYLTIFLTIFSFNNLVEAKSVLVSTVTPSLVNDGGGSFYLDKPSYCNSNFIGGSYNKLNFSGSSFCNQKWPKRFSYYDGLSGFFLLVLNSSYAKAEYYADLINTSDNISKNSPISDESYIPTGSSFGLNGYLGEVEWVSYGGVNDTPIGHWENGAPPPSNLGYKCSGNDYVFSSQLAMVYAPFSVNKPSIYYSQLPETTATLSCSPNGDQCTALSPGKVSLKVDFSQTYGFIYPQYSLYENSGIIGAGQCLYSLNPMYPRIDLPAASIIFNFNVGSPPPKNQKPSISLEGPNEIFVGDNANINFKATDPDTGDEVQVAIDWDANDNDEAINQWLPSSVSYVNSGQEQTTVKTWATSGEKKFKAKALDKHGAESGWVSAFINVKERCGNSNIDPGEQCDGTNLNGQLCTTLGLGFTGGGPLTCTSSCTFNTSNCNKNPVCPNNKKEAGEYCDGTDLGGALCPNGLLGRPTCNSDCTINNNTCYPAVCGDGTKEGVKEECDKGPSNGSRTSGCSKDCKIVPVLPACLENGRCETFNGENPVNCPKDCPATIIETRAPKPSFWAFVLGALGFR